MSEWSDFPLAGARGYSGAQSTRNSRALPGCATTYIKADAATGIEIAHPQFYQRAAAIGGAWTLNATDNTMLIRITELASHHLKTNDQTAVGRPTGMLDRT